MRDPLGVEIVKSSQFRAVIATFDEHRLCPLPILRAIAGKHPLVLLEMRRERRRTCERGIAQQCVNAHSVFLTLDGDQVELDCSPFECSRARRFTEDDPDVIGLGLAFQA